MAVLPQPIDEAQSYLEGLHVPIDVVRQSTLSSVYASATPTLMILNSEGKVTDSWVGQLSPKFEEEVISRLYANAERAFSRVAKHVGGTCR